jgi:hypothetical protein
MLRVGATRIEVEEEEEEEEEELHFVSLIYLTNSVTCRATEVLLKSQKSQDSAVGIATSYGLDDRRIVVRVPVPTRFSPLHVVQTGAHSASCPMSTVGSFSGGKAGGV